MDFTPTYFNPLFLSNLPMSWNVTANPISNPTFQIKSKTNQIKHSTKKTMKRKVNIQRKKFKNNKRLTSLLRPPNAST